MMVLSVNNARGIVSTVLSLSILGATFSAPPALASNSGGWLDVIDSSVDYLRASQSFELSVSVSAVNGVAESFVSCINNSGRQLFRLEFSRFSQSALFISDSGVRTIKFSRFSEFEGSRAGRFAANMRFSFRFGTVWRSTESCTAELTVVDGFGRVTVVDRDRLDLINPKISQVRQPPAQSPKPSPSSPSQPPSPVAGAQGANIFGCALDGSDRNRTPEGLPLYWVGQSCSSLTDAGKYIGIDPFLTKGVIPDVGREAIEWRISANDNLRGAVCRYSFGPRATTRDVRIAKQEASTLCRFIKKIDPSIRTVVRRDYQPKRKNDLTLNMVLFVPE